MKLFVCRWAVCLATLATLAVGAAVQGAAITLFDPAELNDPAVYNEGTPNSRETLFRMTDNVTINQLGIAFDPLNDQESSVGTPDGSITVRYRIYNSNVDEQVFTASPVFQSGPITFADEGLKTYHNSVNVSLQSGLWYILSMEVVTGAYDSPSYASGVAPLTAGDGKFVIEAAGNNNSTKTDGAFGNFNNTILPAFSVSIPEPASLVLVGCGTLLMLRRGGAHRVK